MTQWDIGKLLEVSGTFWETCTLHAGVKLDLFTLIGTQNLTANQIASQTGLNERALTMLLNALTAMKLLEKNNNNYCNTKESLNLLSQESDKYIGYMIMHHSHLVESWGKLDKAVALGKPVRTRTSWDNEEVIESFLMGMFTLAMNIAPSLSAMIDLSDKKHLLDLGGGPGTYAIHFCKNNPNLKATVYDLPTTKPFALKTIEKFGLTQRIDFQDGNYIQDDIKGKYDVIWGSQILHGEGPDECQNILNKAASAMLPGGIIMIHDFILNNTMDGPLLPALFSLNMLIGTNNGQAYSEKQIIELLKNASFKDIKRLSFKGPNDSGIIVGSI